MKYSVVSFLSAAALCSSVNAASLYVNVSGSGTNCYEADPCSTIQMAVNNSSSGDTINVAAGTYVENVHLGSPPVPMTNPGITISGAGADKTFVVSAGISSQRPASVFADIVFDIWSSDVTIEKLSVEHPAGAPIGRDIGFFVSPHGKNVVIQKCNVVRNRTGAALEPTAPGSRGVLVFRAKDTVISKNTFRGNYEDHIHMPTSDSEIIQNDVADAARLGIVIIQEKSDSKNTGNIISRNTVTNSGSDGIQIQGDDNIVAKNEIINNGGAAITLCGESDGDDTIGDGDCVNPFDKWADANGNSVSKNLSSGNGVDGTVDKGTGNVID